MFSSLPETTANPPEDDLPADRHHNSLYPHQQAAARSLGSQPRLIIWIDRDFKNASFKAEAARSSRPQDLLQMANESELSITGSIVGIVALLLSLMTIVQALYSLTCSIRDAPDEILTLFNQISKSSKSLTIARSYLLANFTSKGKDEAERQRYFRLYEASRESLEPSGTLAWALFKQLRSFYPAVNIMRCPVPEVVTDSYNLLSIVRELRKVEDQKSMSLWKRVRWIYKRKDIHVLAGRLSEQQEALNALHLTIINEYADPSPSPPPQFGNFPPLMEANPRELVGQRKLLEEIGFRVRHPQPPPSVPTVV
ncbi:MAG: hypothetical protein M1837_005859 [Sclerophora amabilis]|nr:MAG: hypothetical protein M1837_005859 [Sclerophora amabilis]